MQTLLNWMEKFTELMARIGQWSALLLVGLISVDVLLRYLFDFTLIWILELEIYLFAMIFLLGSGYALQKDKHVRVDVFYAGWSEKRKAWVDLIGGAVLLLPWCILMIWVGMNYTKMSWLINEGSPQPGGLPALYTLKFLLPLAFFLLGIQGISQILKSIITVSK